jgi:hypothetical protein
VAVWVRGVAPAAEVLAWAQAWAQASEVLVWALELAQAWAQASAPALVLVWAWGVALA